MKLRQSLSCTAVLLLVGAVGAAHAGAPYVGGALGGTDYGSNASGISGSGSGVGGKLFVGYQFTPYVAIEGGAVDLGHLNRDPGRIQGDGVYADVVGRLPLNDKWALLGSIGAARIKLDTPNGSDRGNGLKLGLGAQYDLTRNVALRGEWERYQPREFGERPKIDQYTLGVHVAF